MSETQHIQVIEFREKWLERSKKANPILRNYQTKIEHYYPMFNDGEMFLVVQFWNPINMGAVGLSFHKRDGTHVINWKEYQELTKKVEV